MTEPTITCPNCKTEIKLTESLAAPLIASTRQQFEKQLAQKDADIAQRENAAREKEAQLAEAKRHLDEQVADQVASQLKTERAHVAAEEAKKAKQACANELDGKARELGQSGHQPRVRRGHAGGRHVQAGRLSLLRGSPYATSAAQWTSPAASNKCCSAVLRVASILCRSSTPILSAGSR